MGRLKTGTPARLIGDTINYDGLEKQYSDSPPVPFSALNVYSGVDLKDNLGQSCLFLYSFFMHFRSALYSDLHKPRDTSYSDG